MLLGASHGHTPILDKEGGDSGGTVASVHRLRLRDRDQFPRNVYYSITTQLISSSKNGNTKHYSLLPYWITSDYRYLLANSLDHS